MIGIDGNASVGVGEAYFERTSNSLGGRSLGPWGIAHTNAAGHELRSFLLSQNLSSSATFFQNSGAFDQRGQNNTCRNRFGSRRYATGHHATWHHPKCKLPFQLEHILVRGSDMCRAEYIYERLGVQSIEYYIRVRTLRWVGHEARRDKSRLPRRLPTAWVANSRPIGGTEMAFGRSLERRLKHADLPIDFSEWSRLAQDRPKWRALVTAVGAWDFTGSADISKRNSIQI